MRPSGLWLVMPLALPPLPRGSSFVFLALAVVPLCKSQKPNRCRVWLACWSHRAAVLSSFLSRHANPSRKQKGRQNLAASSSRKTPSPEVSGSGLLFAPPSLHSQTARTSFPSFQSQTVRASLFATFTPTLAQGCFSFFSDPQVEEKQL